MPTNLTIGRLGLDTAAVDNVQKITMSGDGVTFTSPILGDSLAELRALRQSALGLVNNRDEPIVPVTYADDSDLDGYYYAKNVNVGSVPASLAVFWKEATFTLERIPEGFAAPMMAGRARATTRDNSHTITEGLSFHAVPDAAEGYLGAANAKLVLDSATGDVKLFTGSGVNFDHYYEAVPTWFLAPADYYKGAAALEIGGVAQMGRQIRNAPDDWLVTNGLVSIGPGSTAGTFNLQVYNGTAWEGSTTDFELYFESGGTVYPFGVDPHAITCLRNTPEEVRIRLTYTGDTVGPLASDEWGFAVDFRLRRGARFVEGVLTSDRSAKWGVRRETSEAHATLADGGGIKANANNAEGNVYVITHAGPFTTIAGGSLYRDVANERFSFGLGWELGGSAATGVETAEEVERMWYCAGGVHSRVVTR